MGNHYLELRAVLARVRSRWQSVVLLRAFGIAAGAASLVLISVLGADALLHPTGLSLVVLAAVALLAVAACFGFVAASLRRPPSDTQVARFVEERLPELEDRVATAVEFGQKPAETSPHAVRDWLLADVSRRVRDLDFERIVSSAAIRRAGLVASASAVVFLLIIAASCAPVRRAYATAWLYVFPEHLVIDVTPGDARLRAGEPLTITARLHGGDIFPPTLTIGEGTSVRTVPMAPAGAGAQYAAAIEAVAESFKYRVTAGRAASAEFTVRVLKTPHVARVDLRYDYPASYGLKPRTEEDSGDIYGPAGTRVRLRVQADKDVATGELVMANGTRVALTAVSPDVREGQLQIVQDGSYRIALTDGDGMTNPGDTEYFIRAVQDRPPDVRILRPKGDQEVTRLQEVLIEASADDDYGIQRFDLVYSIRGRAERAVPFTTTPAGSAVNGSHMLYLEDLDIEPGDFVTYYARARDVARGGRSTEVRSDIYFLEVKPYNEEFIAAPSQVGGQGSVANEDSLEALISAQKDVIAATWKLERRALDSAARSDQDLRALGAAQGELVMRLRRLTAEYVAQGGRATTRRVGSDGARRIVEAMQNARVAMDRAQVELNALKADAALPHEMDALGHLSRAEAEIRRREVMAQNNQGQGSVGNRSQRDLSSLFDRELRRQQETNYETPNTPEQRGQARQDSALEKIRELARRQQQLSREQEALAREQARLEAEELKRRLERLTREQQMLRQQAEDLARELASQQQGGQPSREQRSGQQAGQAGQQSGGQQAQAGARSRSLRDISRDMQGAASDLRRQDPRQASQQSARALNKLRELEQQLEAGQPDTRGRTVGDLQFEARQLADAERQIAAEADRLGRAGGAAADGLRRLAGEQAQLAERLQQLRRKAVRAAENTPGLDAEQRTAIGEAARQLEQQKLEERMRDLAKELRSAADGALTPGTQARGAPSPQATRTGSRERELARALDRVAERLGQAGGPARDGESRQLSEELARNQETQDRLRDLEREIDRLQRQIEQASQSRSEGAGRQFQPSQGEPADDLNALREQLAQQLRQAEQLMAEIGGGTPRSGGRGETPADQQLSQGAPGTEAFKQDFSRWESLKKEMRSALEQIEISLAKKLAEQAGRDRLNAGADERAPDAYQRLVDQYFQALAAGDRR